MVQFYCPTCDKVIGRLKVKEPMWIPVGSEYKARFNCKWCGSRVYRVDKMLASLFADMVMYEELKGDVDKYE